MITFRRCLVAAALILACFYLFPSSHSHSTPTSEHAQGQPLDSAHGRPAPDEASVVSAEQDTQQPISTEWLAQRALRERLRHQFPYDMESKFPAYIWQTWAYTPASVWFEQELRPMEASWSESHPSFIHQVVTDEVAVYFLRYFYAGFPEVLEAYESLPMPVLKADFFRYLILLARGGVYTDIDTFVIQPITDWLPMDLDQSTVGLVVGIEADPNRPDWREWYSRRIQFCQWTIQSKPGHPVLRDIVATITEDTLRMKRAGILTKSRMDKSVVEFTGPAVWTDAIFRYFNNPTYFDMGSGGEQDQENITAIDLSGITSQRKVGDVVVLPITSFSPGVDQMGAGDLDHPMAFVGHEFFGLWKPKAERMLKE